MSLFGGTISKGRSCCVPRCNSRMYGPDGSNAGIHLFRIPGNVIQGKQLKAEWCRLIKHIDGKDNFILTATTSICSEHFHSGVAPTGNVTFVSELEGGRASDKEITLKSKVLNFLEPGYNVMADRVFEIADILPSGVTLNIPPFKGNAAQLTAEQVQNTMDIASVRIHVESAIGSIKNYHILDGIIPLSLSHIANQIFTVIAFLTCFLSPLVAPGKEE